MINKQPEITSRNVHYGLFVPLRIQSITLKNDEYLLESNVRRFVAVFGGSSPNQ